MNKKYMMLAIVCVIALHGGVAYGAEHDEAYRNAMRTYRRNVQENPSFATEEYSSRERQMLNAAWNKVEQADMSFSDAVRKAEEEVRLAEIEKKMAAEAKLAEIEKEIADAKHAADQTKKNEWKKIQEKHTALAQQLKKLKSDDGAIDISSVEQELATILGLSKVLKVNVEKNQQDTDQREALWKNLWDIEFKELPRIQKEIIDRQQAKLLKDRDEQESARAREVQAKAAELARRKTLEERVRNDEQYVRALVAQERGSVAAQQVTKAHTDVRDAESVNWFAQRGMYAPAPPVKAAVAAIAAEAEDDECYDECEPASAHMLVPEPKASDVEAVVTVPVTDGKPEDTKAALAPEPEAVGVKASAAVEKLGERTQGNAEAVAVELAEYDREPWKRYPDAKSDAKKKPKKASEQPANNAQTKRFNALQAQQRIRGGVLTDEERQELGQLKKLMNQQLSAKKRK